MSKNINHDETGTKVIHLMSRLLLVVITVFVTTAGCYQRENNTIEITANSAHLKMLRVNGKAISPSYEISKKHFVSTADYFVEKIYLQAWGEEDDTNIKINGQVFNAGREFSLAVGNNLFMVSLSRNEKVIDQYQLTVIRLPELKKPG